MTPLPKKKHTSARSRQRRNAPGKRTRLPNLIKCQFCGKLKLPHRSCPHCGKYRQ